MMLCAGCRDAKNAHRHRCYLVGMSRLPNTLATFSGCGSPSITTPPAHIMEADACGMLRVGGVVNGPVLVELHRVRGGASLEFDQK